MGSSIRGNDGLDWNDVRFFLAVTRARTMRRAATALGVDETTVGRRIASLEERFGVALFERRPGGFEPTDAGARLVASAERMDEAARELTAWTVDGVVSRIGSVRIATGEGLAERFVVPALRELQARHPDLQATIVTGWEPVDLRKGEADLAVRLVRPTDPRLASRRLARLTLRLYASREYLERAGPVISLAGHPVIGYEDAMRRSGHAFTHLPSTGGHTVLQSNSGRVLVAAGVAGIGIVQLPRYQGDANPALSGVLPELDRPYAVWLVVPQATRRTARIREVSQVIANAFRNAEREEAAPAPHSTASSRGSTRRRRTLRVVRSVGTT
jgi:DNA-binding transcriptional LysR family regulator